MFCISQFLAEKYFQLRRSSRVGSILLSDCVKRFAQFTDELTPNAALVL